MADRGVPVELRRFLAVNHAIGTAPFRHGAHGLGATPGGRGSSGENTLGPGPYHALGLGVVIWSLGGLAFVVYAVANLVLRTRSNHGWYRERFEDYPACRKAVVPGVI